MNAPKAQKKLLLSIIRRIYLKRKKKKQTRSWVLFYKFVVWCSSLGCTEMHERARTKFAMENKGRPKLKTDKVEKCQRFIMLCEIPNVAGTGLVQCENRYVIVRASVHSNVTNESKRARKLPVQFRACEKHHTKCHWFCSFRGNCYNGRR